MFKFLLTSLLTCSVIFLAAQITHVEPCSISINSANSNIDWGYLSFSTGPSFCLDVYEAGDPCTDPPLAGGSVSYFMLSPGSTTYASGYLCAYSKKNYSEADFVARLRGAMSGLSLHQGNYDVQVDVTCYDNWGDYTTNTYTLNTGGSSCSSSLNLTFTVPNLTQPPCPGCNPGGGGGGGGGSSSVGRDSRNSLLYPNPAKRSFNLKLSPSFQKAQNIEVKVFDLGGRIVKSLQFADSFGQLTIDIADLKGGNYLVQAISNENTETLKLSVINQ